jgi:hypothetical protein
MRSKKSVEIDSTSELSGISMRFSRNSLEIALRSHDNLMKFFWEPHRDLNENLTGLIRKRLGSIFFSDLFYFKINENSGYMF